MRKLKIVSILICMVCVCSLTGCLPLLLLSGSNNNEESTEANETNATKETESVERQTESTTEETEQNQTSFEYSDMTVEFIEYKIEEDLSGNQCLVLYFDFTNNSNDSQSFTYNFIVKAFQDGVEMDNTYIHVNDETKNSSKEIKSGMTIRVAKNYKLENISGLIEFEITPFSIWSDKILLEHQFNLGE